MSKVSDVNNASVNGAQAIYLLKELLKTAGWTVPSSSDGSTYNASGDQVTTGGSGAGGMDNNSAWVCVRDPGGRRELVFQRGTSAADWRVTYSALDKFSGGSPSATRVPTATDSGTIRGGGTDASPTFVTIFDASGTFTWHVVADNAPEGNVYPFWAYGMYSPTPTTTIPTLIMLDAMIVGSYSPSDPDPCVLGITRTAACSQSNFANTSTSGWVAWHKMNLAGETFTTASAWRFVRTGSNDASSSGNVNAYDGLDDTLRTYMAANGGANFKGVSKYLRWQLNSDRLYPNTLNLASGAYVPINHLLLPWEDGTAPVA